MKKLLFCLCITGSIYSAEFPPFQQPKKTPDIAELWAQYTSKQAEQSEATGRRRNRLNDDPEQQEEHAQGWYHDLITQLCKIEHAVESEHETPEKKLEEYELACRVIVQAFLHLHDKGNKNALEQVNTRAITLAALIKLKQDPYWNTVLQNISKKKKTAQPPVYSIDELEQDLYIPESKKDRLIKLLLKQLEEQERVNEPCTPEAFEDLSRTLAPHRKKPEEILALFSKIEPQHPTTRIKDKKKAIDLYNGAVTSEIQANIKFLQLQDKHDYLNLEQAYGIVALLYLQAHDSGHPKGLAEAEKIMSGDIMNTIIDWKMRHNMKSALEQFSNIWKEINIRKRKLASLPPVESAPSSSSSSMPSSSSAFF